jgi:selenocysteine-specific elongation factor
MKHLIMGTAGHVDHGKTALIEALTGIDCDTHKEEKRRGITINLGFAHLDLPSGESIGIVDVPGHKDFVHTMVGGASGIDFVLLVIAADSGVMPQTREHLRIMEILGVTHGVMALTRIDLVGDSQLLDLVREEVRQFVRGTFLITSPIVDVSSKTRQGLDRLLEEIKSMAASIEERPVEGDFRMFIDRVFSVSGFGTVVTGSVKSGSLRLKDKVYLQPGKTRECQVRRLERHGKEVDQVSAGDRASINLIGPDKTDVQKGMVLSGRELQETRIVDAALELFSFMNSKSEKSPELGIWSQVIFHTGTYESQAKVHLIDRNRLIPGETALVQVHLQEPCVLRQGDRFVIRSSSSDITLGGGRIIDAAPLYHRRRPGKLIEKLKTIAGGQLPALLAGEVRKANRPVSAEEVAALLNVSPEEVEAAVRETGKLPEDIITYPDDRRSIILTVELQQTLERGILEAVEAFCSKNPLVQRGVTPSEIRGSLKINKSSAAETVLKKMLTRLTSEGKLAEKDKTWTLPVDSEADGQDMNAHIEFFSTYLESLGMQVPLMNDMKKRAKERNLTENQLKQVLYHLTSTGNAYRIKDDYIHASIVDRCRKHLLDWFSGPNKEITVGQFRDLVNGNRKICLLLLARFDSERITKRVGDVRVPGSMEGRKQE